MTDIHSDSELLADGIDETGKPTQVDSTVGSGPMTVPELPILTKAEFLAGFVPPEFIIGDSVQRAYLYSVTAKTAHGKTAVALALSYHVAAGAPLAGRHVEQGNTLYLAGENPDDIRARMILCDEVYNLTDDNDGGDITVIPKIFNIATAQAQIDKAVNDLGGVSLVVVDTGSAYFQGDDDNSNVEMGDFARELRGLTNLPGRPAVLALMHPTKAADKDRLLPRGGGAFLNEVDGNLTLWSDDGGRTTELHWQGKLRGPGFEPVSFKIETQTSDRLVDSKGRYIPSVVALPMSDAEERAAQDRAVTDQDALLESMLNYPNATFADRCKNLGWVSPDGKPRKSKLFRWLETLAKHGLTENGRKGWVLTKNGRKEAENLMGI